MNSKLRYSARKINISPKKESEVNSKKKEKKVNTENETLMQTLEEKSIGENLGDMKVLEDAPSNIYMYFIVILLLLTVISLFLDRQSASYINFGVWFLFTIDYFVRLFKSPKKWYFFKTHILDLIAIIPFYTVFRYFKALTLFFFIFRASSLGKRYFGVHYKNLEESEFGRVFIAFILIFIILPIPLVWIEPQMKTYEDVLWWAIQTTTTVGYGDIVPVTQIGRLVGVILMIIGIGLIGTLASFLTRLFLSAKRLSFKQVLHNSEHWGIEEVKEMEQHLSRTKEKLKEKEKNKKNQN